VGWDSSLEYRVEGEVRSRWEVGGEGGVGEAGGMVGATVVGGDGGGEIRRGCRMGGKGGDCVLGENGAVW